MLNKLRKRMVKRRKMTISKISITKEAQEIMEKFKENDLEFLCKLNSYKTLEI